MFINNVQIESFDDRDNIKTTVIIIYIDYILTE